MGKLVFFLCLLALFGVVYGKDTTMSPTTLNPTTESKSTANPTTQPETTAKPTTQPETTAKPTTQPETTAKPTTQPETTAKPVTAPTTHANVTSNPTTPSTVMTSASPTAKPSPSTYPAKNQYIVTNNNKTCLIANMTVQFYNESNGEEFNVTDHAEVDKARSSCNVLAVKFGNNSFTLTFANDSSYYYLDQVEADIDGDKGNATKLKRAQVKLMNSYICVDGVNVTMNNNVTFMATDVQFQAFGSKNGTFGPATNCNSDLSPIIPIVVGAVLAVLIVIVIIAYLIGRRRSRSGYEEI